MTTDQLDHPAAPAPSAFIPHARTVDRRLVHREALCEVFLTEVRGRRADGYRFEAQLPRSHAYFGDHLARPAMYDPVLLVEVFRQAALAGAHINFGVPDTHKFILTHQTLTLDDIRPMRIGQSPATLTGDVKIVDHRERDGVTTGLDYRIQAAVDGMVAGEATVGLRFKSPADYAALRLKNRGGVLPRTSADLASASGVPVQPGLVGRRDPANVVLLDPAYTDDAVTARLRVPGSHPSMFDHPQDHLPGMVLIEAARQLALHTVLERYGLAPSKAIPTGVEAAYARFGELEPETILTATPVSGADASSPFTTVRVVGEQNAESICDVAITLVRTAG